MNELKKDIKIESDRYYHSFMENRITNENHLLSQGIAYIEFARNEKMIFNALFMSMTMAGSSLQDIIHAEWNRASIENVKSSDMVTELITNAFKKFSTDCEE